MSDLFVTNKEFLRALRAPSDAVGYIPSDAIQWVCIWDRKANWTGWAYQEDEDIEHLNTNSYFCISLLKTHYGSTNRKKAHFEALMCIVLDDVGTKARVPDLQPSWILETSPGNQQWGYILAIPIVDLEDAEALISAIVKVGYCDPGSRDVVHYMRLPVGSNSKPEHMEKNGGNPVPHRLLRWQPEICFSVDDLVHGLSLSVDDSINHFAASTETPLKSNAETKIDAALIKSIMQSETYHSALVSLSARYAGRGMKENDVINTLQGLMLAINDRSERWKERFEAIPNTVASAVKKFHRAASVSDIAFVDFSTLLSSPPPPRLWIVNEWIPRGSLTVMFGRGGVGKSLLSEQLLISVAHGLSFLGLETVQGNALGLFCEDDADELLRRGHKIFSQLNISPLQNSAAMNIDARAGKNNVLVTFGADRKMSLGDLWEHLCDQCAISSPDIILLDNIAQLYGGIENDRHQVTSFCNQLTGLAHENNSAVVILGHPAKAEGSEYSGSTAWEAAVRTRLFLSHNADGSLTLSKAKANYSKLEEIRLQYHDGVFITIGGVESSHAVEQAEASIIEAIKIYTSRQQSCSNSQSANNYIIRMMQKDNMHMGISQAILKHALNHLIDSECILPNTELAWKNASRHPVRGLAINTQY